MISIIVCHRDVVLLDRLKKNIEETIGVVYELVIVDNTLNSFSIFTAYNTGVKKANYDILCFTHEDVLFYSQDWGKKVLTHFEDDYTGMIGVTGGTAQSIVPGAWWYNNYFAKSAISVLMSSSKKPGEDLELNYNNPFDAAAKTEVIIIDGLWFCIRKDLFEKIKFDEQTFTGFHLYDADISMQVGLYAKKYVVFDILLQHVWNGDINKQYYTELEKFVVKWSNHLPLAVRGLEDKYVHLLGWHSLRNVVLDMINKNFEKKYISKIIEQYQPLLSKNYKSNWFSLYFCLSRYLGHRRVNSLFFRLEKIAGFTKIPGYTKKIMPEIAERKNK